MLELLLILGLLIGVPLLAITVIAGSAAYVRDGAERELEAMAEGEAGIDGPERDTVRPDDQQAAEAESAGKPDGARNG